MLEVVSPGADRGSLEAVIPGVSGGFLGAGGLGAGREMLEAFDLGVVGGSPGGVGLRANERLLALVSLEATV